jgi:hypothetical protein
MNVEGASEFDVSGLMHQKVVWMVVILTAFEPGISQHASIYAVHRENTISITLTGIFRLC